jgi:hypothetical protein
LFNSTDYTGCSSPLRAPPMCKTQGAPIHGTVSYGIASPFLLAMSRSTHMSWLGDRRRTIPHPTSRIGDHPSRPHKRQEPLVDWDHAGGNGSLRRIVELRLHSSTSQTTKPLHNPGAVQLGACIRLNLSRELSAFPPSRTHAHAHRRKKIQRVKLRFVLRARFRRTEQ